MTLGDNWGCFLEFSIDSQNFLTAILCLDVLFENRSESNSLRNLNSFLWNRFDTLSWEDNFILILLMDMKMIHFFMLFWNQTTTLWYTVEFVLRIFKSLGLNKFSKDMRNCKWRVRTQNSRIWIHSVTSLFLEVVILVFLATSWLENRYH